MTTEAAVRTPSPASPANIPPRILVIGGGYVGMYTARRILKNLKRGEAIVTVVDPRSYMTYQPFLPEAAAGSIAPRNIVAPLRRVIKGPNAEVVTGKVASVDHSRRTARIEPNAGEAYDLGFDQLVVAVGSVPRTLPIPGLAENGIGFKQVEEAISLRNHIIGQIDLADSIKDEALRRKALTFVFVGGGFAGVEAIAEMEDMARDVCKWYNHVEPEDLRFLLVEAADRILPEVGPELGVWTAEELRKRGIQVKMKTFLQSCVDNHVVLSDGTEVDASTIVWTAGVKPNPVVEHLGIPLGPKGHVDAQANLRVTGTQYVWAAGDCAQVPDLSKGPGNWCSPSAQHAVRQSKVLAENIVAALRGKNVADYVHKHVGSVAGLGIGKGVANVYGMKLRGWPAWFMHRAYHVSRVPTFNRKVRVCADWILAGFFRREAVSLTAFESPRGEFTEVAVPAPAAVAPAKTEEKAPVAA
ncbi:NAD(P)/FAD-dependent oxidoreductase [Actinospica durhamensis]|uniref:NAD(P)/FAD-dependent oxidoreductase n=1 Tax=Actinospica durhamensis TaxID=1508375 RepID=A0A941EU13_9ACTN|nr:NAD(P)/FAD-dependent oxidoreductase [Actinospica durhamensis]MBR7837233.1 NAD(P)/FAD-dependent oxidoreductase [Actinospica durhamensis]